jgi:hypothetical protein
MRRPMLIVNTSNMVLDARIVWVNRCGPLPLACQAPRSNSRFTGTSLMKVSRMSAGTSSSDC